MITIVTPKSVRPSRQRLGMAAVYDVNPLSPPLDHRILALRGLQGEIARLHAREMRLIAAIAGDPARSPSTRRWPGSPTRPHL